MHESLMHARSEMVVARCPSSCWHFFFFLVENRVRPQTLKTATLFLKSNRQQSARQGSVCCRRLRNTVHTAATWVNGHKTRQDKGTSDSMDALSVDTSGRL